MTVLLCVVFFVGGAAGMYACIRNGYIKATK